MEDGKGLRLIFGDDFVQAADFINTMVTSFLKDVPDGVEHKDLYHAFGALSQLHAKAGYGLPQNSSGTLALLQQCAITKHDTVSLATSTQRK